MYLGFLTLALHGMKLRLAALLHLGIAIAVMVIFFVQRTILLTSDLAILTSYAVYIVLMYRLWRGGPDALTRARLSEALRLRIWLLGAIGLLIFVLAFDPENLENGKQRQAQCHEHHGEFISDFLMIFHASPCPTGNSSSRRHCFYVL